MKQKSGSETVAAFIIVIIIVVFGGIIAIIWYSTYIGESKDLSLDNLCTISVSARGGVGEGWVRTSTDVARFILPEACEMRPIDIEPFNKNKCLGSAKCKWIDNVGCTGEKYIKEECEKIHDTVECVKHSKLWADDELYCAAYQVADAVKRCWVIRGAGGLDAGHFTCFSFCMKGLDEKYGTSGISVEELLKEVMRQATPQTGDKTYADIVPLDLVKPGKMQGVGAADWPFVEPQGYISPGQVWFIEYRDAAGVWQPDMWWKVDQIILVPRTYCDVEASPENADTDNDGVCDYATEIPGCSKGPDNCVGRENFNQEDADKDNIGNACDTDNDNDGLSDETEANLGLSMNGDIIFTDPHVADTDSDGCTDREEYDANTNPINSDDRPEACSYDSDGDGCVDADEIINDTDETIVNNAGETVDDPDEANKDKCRGSCCN